MKKLIASLFGILGLIALSGFAHEYPFVAKFPPDDTAILQTQLDAGNVKLPAGSIYHVTGLKVKHTLDMNGATINMTANTGAAIKLVSPGALVTGGTVMGTWDYTTPPDLKGVTGMRILADNCTITKVHVTQFAGYGILVDSCNNPVVTDCPVDKIGSMGLYYVNETKSTKGGTFKNNVIDRSMLPASTVNQLGICIHGSISGTAKSSGWVIANNVIKMPVSPTSSNAECMEIREVANSTISGNTFIGGSIGTSAVRCTGVALISNKFSGSQLEAIEFADCISSFSNSNIITSSAGNGILFDGATGCNGVTLTSDVISGTTGPCINAIKGTQNITITGCTLTASNGAKAINLQQTNLVTIINSSIKGNGVGSSAVMLDTCPGNLTINGGTISNFTKCVVFISNSTSSVETNNINMTGVTVSGVPSALNTYLSNGGTIGKAITVHN
jgi:hypothetical protein